MSGYIRLQDSITISLPQAQEREYAADIGPYNYVTVNVRILKAATGGTIHVEHASVNEESAYVLVGTITNLNPVTNVFFTVQSPLRYLRWRVPTITGDVTLLIDLVVRE